MGAWFDLGAHNFWAMVKADAWIAFTHDVAGTATQAWGAGHDEGVMPVSSAIEREFFGDQPSLALEEEVSVFFGDVSRQVDKSLGNGVCFVGSDRNIATGRGEGSFDGKASKDILPFLAWGKDARVQIGRAHV